MLFSRPKTTMIEPDAALGGREQAIVDPAPHFVNGHSLVAPFPEGHDQLVVGLGCFWGAERLFWQTEGVWVTAVGYAGGVTPNPTYQETCTGLTGHAEIVKVVYDPNAVSYADLLKIFWEAHDPTQGMRQGNDVGTTYRSAIYTTSDEQARMAAASRDAYEAELKKAGRGKVTTEIAPAGEFYYAEEDHQQYLAKNPYGYCGLKGTGVACAVPAAAHA